MDNQLVTIATFDNSFSAESAKALLESSQIEAFLLNSYASSIKPSLALHGGVRLQVLGSQADDAVALLRAYYQSDEGDTAAVHCPSCRSEDVSAPRRSLLAWALLIVTFGLLLAVPGRHELKCNTCGFRWQAQ